MTGIYDCWFFHFICEKITRCNQLYAISMKHYFLILLMTWVCILFIMIASWMMLLFGLSMGDFTILAPIMLIITVVAFFSRSKWFDENVRQPLHDSLEWGNLIEMVIHIQLFTIICGVLGLGVGIAAMTSFYPVGAELALKNLAAENAQWYEFAKYTPMSILSGTLFGFLFYSYLFADAKGSKAWTRGILVGGFMLFGLLALIFGGDARYFLTYKQ